MCYLPQKKELPLVTAPRTDGHSGRACARGRWVVSGCVRGPGCAEVVTEPATRSPDSSQEGEGMPAMGSAEVYKCCPSARAGEASSHSVSSEASFQVLFLSLHSSVCAQTRPASQAPLPPEASFVCSSRTFLAPGSASGSCILKLHRFSLYFDGTQVSLRPEASHLLKAPCKFLARLILELTLRGRILFLVYESAHVAITEHCWWGA